MKFYMDQRLFASTAGELHLPTGLSHVSGSFGDRFPDCFVTKHLSNIFVIVLPQLFGALLYSHDCSLFANCAITARAVLSMRPAPITRTYRQWEDSLNDIAVMSVYFCGAIFQFGGEL